MLRGLFPCVVYDCVLWCIVSYVGFALFHVCAFDMSVALVLCVGVFDLFCFVAVCGCVCVCHVFGLPVLC